MTDLYTIAAGSALARLIEANAQVWRAYTRHPFAEGLGDGTLPEAAFRDYLVQDYLFLIHFSRAWALAAFKADDLEDIRSAAAVVHALVDEEMQLHVETCAGWGLTPEDLAGAPEHPENAAYTRYVLERGCAGDLADLLVALAPCVMGYAEVGARLGGLPAAVATGNPYANWVRTYAGEAYQRGAATAAAQLERVLARRLADQPWTSPRWPSLVATFGQATAFEVRFWDRAHGAR